METNWMILAIVIVCALIVIILLVWRNLKDKEDLTEILDEMDKNENLADLHDEDEV